MLCALGFAQVAARDYGATAEAAEAALREAAQSPTPLILGTIADIGQGRIDKGTETFRNVERIAPSWSRPACPVAG